MSEDKGEKNVPVNGRFSGLSQNVAGFIVGVVLFLLGGLLIYKGIFMDSGWGTVIKIVGGVIALTGGLTARMMLWATLKSLWQGARKKR